MRNLMSGRDDSEFEDPKQLFRGEIKHPRMASTQQSVSIRFMGYVDKCFQYYIDPNPREERSIAFCLDRAEEMEGLEKGFNQLTDWICN